MTTIFHLTMPSNQQNLLLTMVQVLYLLEVVIMAQANMAHQVLKLLQPQ